MLLQEFTYCTCMFNYSIYIFQVWIPLVQFHCQDLFKNKIHNAKSINLNYYIIYKISTSHVAIKKCFFVINFKCSLIIRPQTIQVWQVYWRISKKWLKFCLNQLFTVFYDFYMFNLNSKFLLHPLSLRFQNREEIIILLSPLSLSSRVWFCFYLRAKIIKISFNKTKCTQLVLINFVILTR